MGIFFAKVKPAGFIRTLKTRSFGTVADSAPRGSQIIGFAVNKRHGVLEYWNVGIMGLAE